MNIFQCNECGFEKGYIGVPFSYCPSCGALAAHLQSACSSILGLANIDKGLADAVRLFKKNEYLNAARTAMVLLETRLKELGGTDMFGTRLVKHVLSFDYDKKSKTMIRPPIIPINDLDTNVKRGEQEGFMALVLGIFQGLRNVIMHDQNRIQPVHALAILINCDIAFDVLSDGSLKNERVCVWKKIKADDA